jgi:hypothetical protein
VGSLSEPAAPVNDLLALIAFQAGAEVAVGRKPV